MFELLDVICCCCCSLWTWTTSDRRSVYRPVFSLLYENIPFSIAKNRYTLGLKHGKRRLKWLTEWVMDLWWCTAICFICGDDGGTHGVDPFNFWPAFLSPSTLGPDKRKYFRCQNYRYIYLRYIFIMFIFIFFYIFFWRLVRLSAIFSNLVHHTIYG